MALPADTLRNRTFIGLLIAQFFAAFNDQAIHASAMFFAINQKALTKGTAITLMPILFYAPWAIFVTLAGYFADRYSKRTSLVFWKLAEVGIMVVATVGFYFSEAHGSSVGPWIVLACVFLMGMHSAFFVPAKYGAMPEILQPQLLSRGNGILESLSFLAVILGTVCGGVMYGYFDDTDREYCVGLVLLGLAIVGAVASLLIRPIPPANVARPFPAFVYGPLYASLKTLFRSRPLRLAMIGIAFFTFMVAFMRATVYMLGESQIPRWEEAQTSAIVGATSLGIGLGAPLAGWLSGRKVELGLVPLGAYGMAIAAVLAAVFIDDLFGLVACIVAIGFFTGFYLVPLFTLQQHRAPKRSKGDVVAASNFVNVIGAILASFVFGAVVYLFQEFGLTNVITPTDVTTGALVSYETQNGRAVSFDVQGDQPLKISTETKQVDIEMSKGIPARIDPDDPPDVAVAGYKLHGIQHYVLRLANKPLEVVHDQSHLPKYLFAGAGIMAILTLMLLKSQMPDLTSRMIWALHSLRQTKMHVVGTGNLPSDGPVVLITNCRDAVECRNVVSATDRYVEFVVTKLSESQMAATVAKIENETIIALAGDANELLEVLQKRVRATFLPTYFGPGPDATTFRVAFGTPLPVASKLGDLRSAIAAAAALSEAEEVH
ncbi:MAG: MFS transporter [Gemmataceae bacterium]